MGALNQEMHVMTMMHLMHLEMIKMLLLFVDKERLIDVDTAISCLCQA
jgi:hypothetical protein